MSEVSFYRPEIRPVPVIKQPRFTLRERLALRLHLLAQHEGHISHCHDCRDAMEDVLALVRNASAAEWKEANRS